jgi:ubiquinone/menaquinone biosynthesis C-methylase UbiE
MNVAESRKTLIQDSYNREAARYVKTSQAQTESLFRLFSLSEIRTKELRPRKILDVGCGTGPVISVFHELGLFPESDYLGIDLSAEMIALAKQNHESARIHFSVGDAEALAVEDQSIDVVISNAMLHWLNQPKLGTTPLKAFSEIYRVLKPGGLFLASISGYGTVLLFLTAYRETMERYKGRAEFDASQYLDEPLGSMYLHEVVQLAHMTSFKIELAQNHYHNLELPSAGEYLNTVRGYGFNIYTGPIAPNFREAAWLDISEVFTSRLGSGPCLFEWYQNYLIAVKPHS